MSIETDIVIFIVKSFSFEWWWLDNKEVLVVMVRRFSGVSHSYIDKVVYACALSGYLLTLKHISDKRKVMKEKANGLPCLFKIQSKCASFLSNETTESKKKYFGIIQSFIVRKHHIDEVFLFNCFLKVENKHPLYKQNENLLRRPGFQEHYVVCHWFCEVLNLSYCLPF